MKIKNLIFCLIILVTGFLNVGNDLEEYLKLKNEVVPLVKKDDLPEEFSDDAYGTIVDFIEKTHGLTCE